MTDGGTVPHDFSTFITLAREFKKQLIADGSFTDEEIAAMLGQMAIGLPTQTFATTLPPEFFEMMTKQNVIADKMIAEDER